MEDEKPREAHPQAKEALLEAVDGVSRQNGKPEMRLEILGRLAENEYRREDRPEALVRLQNAREFVKQNNEDERKEKLTLPSWLVAIQMDLDKQLDNQPLSAKEMTASVRGMRDLGVVPTVDYRVLFDTDSDRLTPEAESQLQKVAESLGSDSGKIQVIGHTDKRGTKEHNQTLSEKRAARVVTWLAGHNPSLAGHLVASGKGMTEPKYFGDNDDGYQMNRRVEFVFGGMK